MKKVLFTIIILLGMAACNTKLMTSLNEQNYYLREADGKISLIPWDYNLAWGGYPEDDEHMEGEDMLEQSQNMALPTGTL